MKIALILLTLAASAFAQDDFATLVKKGDSLEAQLKTKEAHFRSLVAGATDLTLVLDDKLIIQWQSPDNS